MKERVATPDFSHAVLNIWKSLGRIIQEMLKHFLVLLRGISYRHFVCIEDFFHSDRVVNQFKSAAGWNYTGPFVDFVISFILGFKMKIWENFSKVVQER